MSKILKNKDELLNIMNTFNRKSNKIIMVNGCFDLFHVGHLNLLKFAKNQGNVLFVAVNSDYSINKLKGSSRPIIAQDDRLAILSSLVYIDYVVLFDEETPSELIEIIKPDAIAKEEEYKNKEITEIDTIKKYNINLIFYKKENEISTSFIINKILSLRDFQNYSI